MEVDRRRRSGLVAAVTLLLVGAGLTGIPAAYGDGAQAVPQPRLAAPAPPPGSRALGPLDPSRRLDVEVVLAPADPQGVAALLESVYSPTSPDYHHWLTSAQAERAFAPSVRAMAAVTSWLTGAGIKASTTTGSAIRINATAGKLTAALGVSLGRYANPDGREHFTSSGAPKLPAAIGSTVTAIVGLDDVAAATPNIASPRPSARLAPSTPQIAGPNQPCQDATAFSDTNGWYTNPEIGAVYGIDALIASGQQGAGVTVAIPEFAAYSPSDVAAYTRCFGLTNSVSSILVDGGAAADPLGGTPEADLDIEQVATQAPASAIAVYTAPNSNAGAYDLWSAIVHDNTASVISYSWGMCEADQQASGFLPAMDNLFRQAAAQGQTVVVASGDSGSEGCYPTHGSTAVYPDYPGSDPWVTAVGGTQLDAFGDTTWNYCQAVADTSCVQQGGGAGGGGDSQFFGKPSWQPSLAPCGDQCREVPDLSANAGIGEVFYINGGWAGAAGTSVAAPLVAGLLADRNSGCAVGRIGNWAPSLYSYVSANASLVVNDVTRGDNDLTRTNAGLFQARAGYDLATGLGTPRASGLVCAQVLSITPLHGAPGSTAVLSGLGLEGAAISFGTTRAQVLSTSATFAQVVVPAGSGALDVSASGVTGQGLRTTRFTTAPAQVCSAATDIHVSSIPWVLTAMEATNGCLGYWMATQAGQVATFGAATFQGDLSQVRLNGQVVGMSTTPDGGGYWMLGADGGIFAFGDAGFYGSTGAVRLNKPVVGMAATPSGRGYWLVASDGGIFAFGDAGFYGSTGAVRLNKPVVGMAATPSGRGYWLVASDGGIFAFGDAGFYGSTGGVRLAKPVVGMTTGPTGHGYRLVGSDGGVFTFGDAAFYGSLGAHPPAAPVTTMAASVDGQGYYMTGIDGAVYPFGDAPYLGRAIVN